MADIFHCIYMYHIFFIHSFVYGHLGYFHILAIVNSAAMNTEVHVSFRSMVFSGCVPRSGISGSYGSFIFIFLRNPLQNSLQRLYQFTFSLRVQDGSLFSTPSCAFWPSIYFLWRNVCLDLLCIFCLFVWFFILSCMSYLYILEINPLLVTFFANIFCHSLGCLFIAYGLQCYL